MKKRNPKRNSFQAFSISKSSEANKAFNSLARLLSKRDHSEKEIQMKLGRYYTEDAVAKALEKANEYGYLKDPAELQKRFTQTLNNKGRGHFKIQFELKKRGLPGTTVIDTEVEFQKALRHVDKIVSVGDDLDLKKRMKITRLLKNRGFTGDTIKAVFEHLRTAAK